MRRDFEANTLSIQMTVSPATVVTDPESYDKGYEAGVQAGGGSVTPEQIKQAVDNYLEEHPVEFTETDPTVPDWAKQPNKPTYTAAEVGTYSSDSIDKYLDEKANVDDVFLIMHQKANQSEVNDGLDKKADKADTYTKTEVDNLIYSAIGEALEGSY